MNIRNFIIQIGGVFLSISLAETIEQVIVDFSCTRLMAGILVFFLSLNFFYAKFKQLAESEGQMSLWGFMINIITLSSFAAMPYLVGSFVGLMCSQIFLRVSDIGLIIYDSTVFAKKGLPLDIKEKRWLAFDIIYLVLIIVFIAIEKKFNLAFILLSVYFGMVIFEVLFDFIINQQGYGLINHEKSRNNNLQKS